MPNKKHKPVNDLTLNKEAKAHWQTLMLWPKLWKGWKPRLKLKWESKPFSHTSKGAIPNKPGVYAFVIMPGVPPGVPNSVLMYIGKSDRPLRERFREYLREKDSPTGRPALSTMLQMYDGYVHFYCACMEKGTRPKMIENHLIETLAPPMNKQYPAKISRIMGAW